MLKCEECLHRSVCEKRTCSECSGGFGCDDCEIYHTYDGKPSIENCKHFRADEAEVKRGKWKEHFVFDCWHYDCPFCDDGYATKDKDKTPPNYCQNCGARLLGKESDNNAEEKCHDV